MNDQAKPIAAITAIWDKDSQSIYPETVKIPMDNDHVVTYRIDIEQPHPCFESAMDLLKKMPVYGGYKYKEAKKTKRAGTRDGRFR